MKDIKTFIKKGIKGGYQYRWYMEDERELGINELPFREIEVHVLDPLLWQAVGKVEGWEDGKEITYTVPEKDTSRVSRKGLIDVHIPKHTVTRMYRPKSPVWKKKMNGLTPALIEGKTIEEYIISL